MFDDLRQHPQGRMAISISIGQSVQNTIATNRLNVPDLHSGGARRGKREETGVTTLQAPIIQAGNGFCLSMQSGNQKRKHYTKFYLTYLRSNEWFKVREKVLKLDGFKCRKCSSSLRLQVHHKTYKRLGRERMSDLITLCYLCHKSHHKQSIALTRRPGKLRREGLNPRALGTNPRARRSSSPS